MFVIHAESSTQPRETDWFSAEITELTGLQRYQLVQMSLLLSWCSLSYHMNIVRSWLLKEASLSKVNKIFHTAHFVPFRFQCFDFVWCFRRCFKQCLLKQHSEPTKSSFIQLPHSRSKENSLLRNLVGVPPILEQTSSLKKVKQKNSKFFPASCFFSCNPLHHYPFCDKAWEIYSITPTSVRCARN